MGPDPASPPSRSSSLSFCPPPLVATCIPPCSRTRPDSHPLTRLDSSLVSLFSSSFPSPVDGPLPRIYLPTITFSTSLLPLASLSTHAYLPTGALSSLEALFLLGDKCKTKTYSPLFYSLCKYAGIATSVWPEFSLRFCFLPASSSASQLRLPLPSSSRSYVYSIQRMDTGVSCGCNWNDGLFYFSTRDC